MARNYFAEEIGGNVAISPSRRDYFSEEIKPSKRTRTPVLSGPVGAGINIGKHLAEVQQNLPQENPLLVGPMSPRFAGEIAVADPRIIPMNIGINVAEQAQRTGANPIELSKSVINALPFSRLARRSLKSGVVPAFKEALKRQSFTEPYDLKAPVNIVENVGQSFNPEFKVENPATREAINLAGYGVGGMLENASMEPLRMAKAKEVLNLHKNLPSRVARLRSQMGQRIINENANFPKALPSPTNLGEGFQILSPEQAAQGREAIKQEVIQKMGLPKRKALSPPENLGEGFEIVNPAESRKRIFLKDAETLGRMVGEGVRKGVMGEVPPQRKLLSEQSFRFGKREIKPSTELGFARFGKNYENMSEQELKAEFERLRGKRSVKLPINPNLKERKFIETVRESKNTVPQVAENIEGSYQPITNKETLLKAQGLINTNIDEAIRIAKSDATPTAESNAVAISLIDKFQNEGRYQDAIDIVEKTAAKATSQGQAIQALSIYSRLSPEGVLRFAQRVIDKANAESPKSGLKISEGTAKDLVETAKRLQQIPEGRVKIIETAKLMKKVQDQVPPSLLKKISSVQTLAQLLNPKTAIRNLIGNVGFMGLENVSDVVATGYDKALSQFTGKRSKVLPGLTVQGKGFLKGGKQAIEEIKQGVNISPSGTQFDLPKTGAFKSGVGKKLEDVLNYELRVPDRAFYQAAFDGSLDNQMRATKLKSPTIEMIKKAHLDALYRTFQDDNIASRIFTKIKQALNAGQEFGIGDLIIKYPKTPGALFARGIEYSPVGFFKSAIDLYRMVKGGSQKSFVESSARATIGTGIVATGILLAKLGIVTGKKEQSKGLNELRQETGIKDYQVNISALQRFIESGFDPRETTRRSGDELRTYDWFQPAAIPFAIGADIEENKGDVTGTVGSIAEAIKSGGETLAGQPLVSGITRLFGQGGGPVAGFEEMLKGVPTSFTPTLLNQIKLLVDDTARDISSENPLKESMNRVQSRLPVISKNLPPKLTPFGEEKKYRAGEGINRVGNVFLNPAIANRYGESQNTDISEELLRLGISIPEQANKLSSIPLKREEIFNTTKRSGQIAKDILVRVIRSSQYQRMNDYQREKFLENIVRNSKEIGQFQIGVRQRVMREKIAQGRR